MTSRYWENGYVGLIGLYVNRIYVETKNYLINKTVHVLHTKLKIKYEGTILYCLYDKVL